MATYPVIVILIGVNFFTFYLHHKQTIPVALLPVGMLFSCVVAWIYWSKMITKWRLWAFENVRNVHELKKRAIREKLIWEDGSFLSKTEIKTSLEKEKLNALQEKFKIEDLFHDDLSIPDETIIYYAKGKNYLEMVMMMGIVGFGIYLLATTDSYIIGSIVVAVGAFLTYKEYKEATNTKPQIIINEKGMQTASTIFYEWKEIEDEEAISERRGKHTSRYLKYNFPAGSEKFLLNDLDTTVKIINNLLQIYKGRYMQKRKSK